VIASAPLLETVGPWDKAGAVGASLFDLVSLWAFWGCLGCGVFVTSVCLSEEKRAGTLGLLFLTRLRPFDVVLGKLAISSLNTIQVLLAIFPVLAVTMVLGGVEAAEFWCMLLVLLNTMFLSLSAGIFVSSVSRRPAKAMLGTAALIASVTGGLGWLDQILLDWAELRIPEYWLLPGPYEAFSLVRSGSFQLALNSFWPSTIFTFWLWVGFMAWASVILPWTCRDRIYRSPLEFFLSRWVRRSCGEPGDLVEFRRQALDGNPVFWLASRHRWKWVYLWGLFLLAIGSWVAALFYFEMGRGQYAIVVFVCLAPILHGMIKLAIISHASFRVVEARRNGELELLLSTPLTERQICGGFLNALRNQFLAPLVVVAGVDVALMYFSDRLLELDGETSGVVSILLWAMLIMLVMDARTLAWVGLWQGLGAKNVFVAVRETALRVLVVPWIIFFASLVFSPFLYAYGLVVDSESGWVMGGIVWWWIVGFMANTVFQLGAQRKLYDRFRLVAANALGRRRASGYS
jgi:hypothetical protein